MITEKLFDNPSTSYVEDTEDSNISIELYSSSAILLDNTLTPQIISWDDFNIASEELYRGSRYDDTCIAEVDFQKEDGSWVFGE